MDKYEAQADARFWRYNEDHPEVTREEFDVMEEDENNSFSYFLESLDTDAGSV